MRTIWVLKGLPASGKGTWSFDEMKKYPGKYKRVNKDDIRAMLDCDEWSSTNEKFVLDVRDFIVEKALMKGKDVIVDDTNFHNKHWEKMCSIAKRIGDVRVVEKFFDVPLEECLRRNAARARVVPEGIVRKMFNDYVKCKHVEIRDEYFPKETPVTMEVASPDKKKAVIVDVDGTVALNTNGRDYYDLTQVLNDAPHTPVIDLVQMLHAQDYRIIIVSGREDLCQADTEMWLKIHGVPYHAIFMRKAGDNRRDEIVKEEIYRELIEPHYSVRFAFDDRPRVCRLWRSLNFTTLQLNDIDF